MEWTWRPLTRTDVPAWARLLAAAERCDDTGEHYGEVDLAEELDEPGVDPDLRLGAWIDNELVAYVALRPRTVTSYWRIHGEGVVHPRHRGRGIGTDALRWIERRVIELCESAQPGVEARMHVIGRPHDPAQVELLTAAGYLPANWSAAMTVDLKAWQAPAAAPLPAGWQLRVVAPEWADRLLNAHNDAFADHWGFAPWTPVEWQQWEVASHTARPRQSYLVEAPTDPGRVAGYLLTHEYDADTAATGRRDAYVAKLGVRREHRGRGLATRLLRHALTRYVEAGFDTASLDVDTNNPTGAFALYERVGFRIERRQATYERRIQPG